MDLKALIAGRDAIISDLKISLKTNTVDAAVAARPVALQRARIDTLKARIAALQQAKSDQAARIDTSIADLRDEISGLETQLKSSKTQLAQVGKAVSAEKTKTTATRKKPTA